MIKKNILTAFGIILSFAIAIGGWVLTSFLLEIKSDELLSLTLNVATNTLGNTPQHITNHDGGAGDNLLPARPTLSEDEIVGVLRNWSWKYVSAFKETPHEPTDEQLNMEQAIETAREWLSFIGGLNIFPAESLYFEKPSAYLAQKLLPELSNLFLLPAYSYWAVSFTNESMSINLTINAVTGQVWQTDIKIYRTDIVINGYDVTNALAAFTSIFDINFEGSGDLIPVFMEEGVFYAILTFADGEAVAAVTASGSLLGDGRLAASTFLMDLLVN